MSSAPSRISNANAAGFYLDDAADFARATKGRVAQHATGRIEGAAGNVVWDINRYAFLEDPTAPDTVHPSLWRQARLNAEHGLFAL